MPPFLSVVIPALDEEARLPAAIRSVRGDAEVIVVDGGSRDATRSVATREGARVLTAPRGRGLQLAAGARAAGGEWIVFLHADTRLESGWAAAIGDLSPDVVGGAFRFAIDSPRQAFRVVEAAVLLRVRLFALPYGDQGLFARRDAYDRVGGIPELPLMEDVAFVRRLRGAGRLAFPRSRAFTSPRRWERHGIVATTLRNWRLIALYAAGRPPERLAGMYGGAEREERSPPRALTASERSSLIGVSPGSDQSADRARGTKRAMGAATTRAAITALGRYVPERVMTNTDLEKLVDTSDEWIRSRTGIRERHVAEPGTPTSELAVRAARMALDKRGIGAEDIDLIIVGTVTPDTLFPSTACIVQDKLGAKRAWAFDLAAACSGFVYALTTGAQFIQSGAHRKVLVIGADVMSTIIDYRDRTTCVLFGDGAGAVLLEPSKDETGIIDFYNEVDGSGGSYLNMPAGGSARPASHETVDQRMHFVRQDGPHVFKYAVRKFAEATQTVLARNGLTAADLDLYVAHQANLRIIEASRERLGLPEEKVVKNIDRYGNTTAATIPLALATALDEGRLRAGHRVVLVSVGAGLTVGAILMRWSGVPW